MKLTILTRKLERGLSYVEKVVSRSQILPSLSGVLLRARENKLQLTCTDIELALTWEGLAKVEKEGEAVIPVRVFSELISYVKENQVEIEQSENDILIKTETIETRIRTLPLGDFPAIPEFKSEQDITLLGSELVEGLQSVFNFSSPTTVSLELSGVLFWVKDKEVIFTATDRFRLGEKRVEMGESAKERKVVLPSKTVSILSSSFGKLGEVKVMFGEHLVGFKAEDELEDTSFFLLSKLIDAEFPEYKEIIPQTFTTTLMASKEELIDKIKACGVFSGRSNEIVLEVFPDEGMVSMRSENPETGSFQVKLPAKIEGQPFKVIFDWKYLLEGLSKIKDKEVFVGLTGEPGEEGPALIKPHDPEERFVYIVMPIQSSS